MEGSGSIGQLKRRSSSIDIVRILEIRAIIRASPHSAHYWGHLVIKRSGSGGEAHEAVMGGIWS